MVKVGVEQLLEGVVQSSALPGFAWVCAVFLYHGPCAQGSGSNRNFPPFLDVLGELGRLKSRVPRLKAPWEWERSRCKSEQQGETSRRCCLCCLVVGSVNWDDLASVSRAPSVIEGRGAFGF